MKDVHGGFVIQRYHDQKLFILHKFSYNFSYYCFSGKTGIF